jgi:hypothetical protein
MKIHQHYRLNMAFPTHGPVVCANLTRPIGFVPKSQRVYLYDPHLIDQETVRIMGRTQLGVLEEFTVAWSDLEHVRVESVPVAIAGKVQQASKEDNERWAKVIREQRVKEINDWSVDLS